MSDGGPEDNAMNSDAIYAVAIAALCVLGALVLVSVAFFGWLWCVNRKEKLVITRQKRREEHLKYLEEYSIRTEEDEDGENITPRSNGTIATVQIGDNNGTNDSGYEQIDEWEPHKVDHSSSLEASSASTVFGSSKGFLNNNSSSYENYAMDTLDTSDMVTHLDDVKL